MLDIPFLCENIITSHDFVYLSPSSAFSFLPLGFTFARLKVVGIEEYSENEKWEWEKLGKTSNGNNVKSISRRSFQELFHSNF